MTFLDFVLIIVAVVLGNMVSVFFSWLYVKWQLEWSMNKWIEDSNEETSDPEPVKYCYQCDKPVKYLFPDSRCKDCTRITPEELVGDVDYDDA